MIPDSPILTEYEQRLAEAWAARSRTQGDPAALIAAICSIFEITEDELIAPSRVERLVDARCVIAHVLTQRGWTHEGVGRLLHRHPATVFDMLKRIANDFELKTLAKEMAA